MLAPRFQVGLFLRDPHIAEASVSLNAVLFKQDFPRIIDTRTHALLRDDICSSEERKNLRFGFERKDLTVRTLPLPAKPMNHTRVGRKD